MSTKDNSLEASFRQLLAEHEAQTNKFADKINWLWTGLFGLFLGIDIYYYYAIANNILNICAVIFYIAMFVSAHFIVKRIGYGHKWAKVVFIVPIMISCCMLRVLSTYNPVTLFAVLILVSGLYLNKRYVLRMAYSSMILLVISGIAYVIIDFDHMASGNALTVHDQLIWHTLPNFIVLIIITVYSLFVADSSKRYLRSLISASSENTSLHNELTIAKSIQAGVLPPVVSRNSDYDVYSYIESAKYVGGDYYNYSRIDEHRVALCIADVSGKGIPAAVMAINSNTFIESFVKSRGYAIGMCEAANQFLCKHNPEKLFETAIFVQLDISNGMLVYVNAGHIPPAIIHQDGTVETLKCKPNFVLGIKPDYIYSRERVFLTPGDRVFLYTDGITEAMNTQGELFGTKRLYKALEKHSRLDGEKLIESVRAEVKAFAGEAEQSDDITMLLLDYNSSDKSYKIEEETFEIRPENLSKVVEFVQKNPREIGCSEKILNELAICVDEIFANLDMHAYPASATERPLTVKVSIWENQLKISFADKGKAFNPLESDIFKATEGVKNHKKGGLGIFLVKNMADFMFYNYTNTNNVLTIIKNLDKRWK